MSGDVIFITHPDVQIEPHVPVPSWALNERGRQRMEAMARRSWMAGVQAVFASGERKAQDGAAILCNVLGIVGYRVIEGLGENDRSATGYLDPLAFEAMADAFFAQPKESVRGWEPALDAQHRVVEALGQVLTLAPPDGDVAIVGHGGTGTLLRCHLGRFPIDRRHDQPLTKGGNWFAFCRADLRLLHSGWRSIDLD